MKNIQAFAVAIFGLVLLLIVVSVTGCNAQVVDGPPPDLDTDPCLDHTADEMIHQVACDEATAPTCGIGPKGEHVPVDGADHSPPLSAVCHCVGGVYSCWGSPGLAPSETAPSAPNPIPVGECARWVDYPVPAGSCLFASASVGVGLTDQPFDSVCSTPAVTFENLTAYTPDGQKDRTVSLFCSSPGLCRVHVDTPATNLDCAQLIGR